MVARKTCTVLLVDVSPTMRAHLPWVGDHLSRVVQNRLLYQRNDEFALVTCGACRRTDGLRGSDRDRGAAMTRLERAFLIHVAPTRERDYVNLCYYYYDVVDT